MGKRGFVQRACEACHRRKVKCKAEFPGLPCSQCHLRHRQCVFPGEDRSTSKTSHSVSSSGPAHDEPLAADPVGDSDPTSSTFPGDDLFDITPVSSNPSNLRLPFAVSFDSLSPQETNDLDSEELFHLMVQYITIPSPGLTLSQSQASTLLLTPLEEQRLISAFFDRSDIISDVVRPLYEDIVDTSPLSSPAANLLRQAIICCACLEDRNSEQRMATQQVLAGKVYDTLKSFTTSGDAEASGIHVICSLVVMTDVWPNIPKAVSRPSPLIIDVTEVEAVLRLWIAYRDSHPANLSDLNLLDWYIHLLDAMDAAHNGRPASLNSIPETNEDSSGWSLAASRLVDIGRTMGYASGNLQWDRLLSLHDDLQRWICVFAGPTANSGQDGCHIFPLLLLLLHHLSMSLENHVSHMPPVSPALFAYAHLSATVKSQVIRAAAGVSWSAVLDILEQQSSGATASAYQSSIFIEVGVGCLFWGLEQAKMHLSASDHQPMTLALIVGSHQFIRFLEPRISHRLDLLDRLVHVKEELLRLACV